MQKRVYSILGVLFGAFLLAFPIGGAQASIINGGFESGLTGWSVAEGASSDVSTLTTDHHLSFFEDVTYGPTQGSAFVRIRGSGIGSGRTSLQQMIPSALAGDILSFDINLLSNDCFCLDEGINDTWEIKVAGVSIYFMDTEDVGSELSTGWLSISHTFLADMNDVALIFSARNVGDLGFSPEFLVDNVVLTSSVIVPPPSNDVPEPGALSLLTAGFGGLLIASRRRSKIKSTINLSTA